MNSFKNLYKQLKATEMTHEQASIIANALSNIDGRLKIVEEEIGNLHSNIDIGFADIDERFAKKFDKVMNEFKEIKEKY